MEIIFGFLIEVIGNFIILPLLNLVGAMIRRIVLFYKDKVDMEYFIKNGTGYNYLISAGIVSLLVYHFVK